MPGCCNSITYSVTLHSHVGERLILIEIFIVWAVVVFIALAFNYGAHKND
jgi:hypothetical protein